MINALRFYVIAALLNNHTMNISDYLPEALIDVWDGSSGGTANCVKYAQSINKDIIYINPEDFK